MHGFQLLMCVCMRKKSAFVMQCDVCCSSSFEELIRKVRMILVIAVCNELCITERTQAV
jgi:hypothetical protein